MGRPYGRLPSAILPKSTNLVYCALTSTDTSSSVMIRKKNVRWRENMGGINFFWLILIYLRRKVRRNKDCYNRILPGNYNIAWWCTQMRLCDLESHTCITNLF